jgi:hypothetical protein
MNAPTVSDSEFWMGYCVGLDNRRILPPFFPYRGNEDGIFITAALACYKTGFAGHVPSAIRHAPPGIRLYAPDDMLIGFSKLRAADILCSLVRWAESPYESVEGAPALRRLGSTLADAAEDKIGFAELAHRTCWQVQVNRLHELERSLALGDGPPRWRQHIESQILAIRASLLSRSFPQPFDSPPPGRAGRAAADMDEVRREVHAFGRLCFHWPDIVAATRDLAQRGVDVTVSL